MQQDELEALVAEIDSILGEAAPRLPWVMSNDTNQRQLLARARACLADMKAVSGLSVPATEAGALPADSTAAGSSQVLKALLQEMQYLRSQTMQILDPLRHEVATLRQQREKLLQEVQQLQQQRLQLDQGATFHQLPPSWEAALQQLAGQLEAQLNAQVSQSVQRLELATANAYGLTQLPAGDAYGDTPGLSPTQRLEFLKQLQAQSDQLMVGLDQSLRSVFDSLQQSLYTYQNSLNQGLNQMHSLGQQGELMFSALVNHLGQQINQDTLAYLEAGPRRELPQTSPAVSNPETLATSSFAPEGAAIADGFSPDLEADLAFESLAFDLDDDEITLLQIEDEISELQLGDELEAMLDAEGQDEPSPLDLELLDGLEASAADPSPAVSLPEAIAADIDAEAAVAVETDSALEELYQSLFGTGGFFADSAGVQPSQESVNSELAGGATEVIDELDTFLETDLGSDRSPVAGSPADLAPAAQAPLPLGEEPRPEDFDQLLQAAIPPMDAPDSLVNELDELFGADAAAELGNLGDSAPASGVDVPAVIESLDELLPALPEDLGSLGFVDDDEEDSLGGFMAASPEENLLAQEDLPATAAYDLTMDETIVEQLKQDLENLEVATGFEDQSGTFPETGPPAFSESSAPPELAMPEPPQARAGIDLYSYQEPARDDGPPGLLTEASFPAGGSLPPGFERFEANLASPHPPALPQEIDGLEADATAPKTPVPEAPVPAAPIDRGVDTSASDQPLTYGLDLFEETLFEETPAVNESDVMSLGPDLSEELILTADLAVPETADIDLLGPVVPPLDDAGPETLGPETLGPEILGIDLFNGSGPVPSEAEAERSSLDQFTSPAAEEVPAPGMDRVSDWDREGHDAIASASGIDLFSDAYSLVDETPPSESGPDLFGDLNPALEASETVALDVDLFGGGEPDLPAPVQEPEGIDLFGEAPAIAEPPSPPAVDSFDQAPGGEDLFAALGNSAPPASAESLSLASILSDLDLSLGSDVPALGESGLTLEDLTDLTADPAPTQPSEPLPSAPVTGATGPSLTLENMLGELTLDPSMPLAPGPKEGITLDDLTADSLFGSVSDPASGEFSPGAAPPDAPDLGQPDATGPLESALQPDLPPGETAMVEDQLPGAIAPGPAWPEEPSTLEPNGGGLFDAWDSNPSLPPEQLAQTADLFQSSQPSEGASLDNLTLDSFGIGDSAPAPLTPEFPSAEEPELTLDSWNLTPPPEQGEPDLTLESWNQTPPPEQGEPGLALESWNLTPPPNPAPSAAPVIPLSLTLDDLNLSLDDLAGDEPPSPAAEDSLDNLAALGDDWSVEVEPSVPADGPLVLPSPVTEGPTDWQREISLDNILDAAGASTEGEYAPATPAVTADTPDPIQAAAAAAAESMEAIIDFINLDSLLGEPALPVSEAPEPYLNLDLDFTLAPDAEMPDLASLEGLDAPSSVRDEESQKPPATPLEESIAWLDGEPELDIRGLDLTQERRGEETLEMSLEAMSEDLAPELETGEELAVEESVWVDRTSSDADDVVIDWLTDATPAASEAMGQDGENQPLDQEGLSLEQEDLSLSVENAAVESADLFPGAEEMPLGTEGAEADDSIPLADEVTPGEVVEEIPETLGIDDQAAIAEGLDQEETFEAPGFDALLLDIEEAELETPETDPSLAEASALDSFEIDALARDLPEPDVSKSEAAALEELEDAIATAEIRDFAPAVLEPLELAPPAAALAEPDLAAAELEEDLDSFEPTIFEPTIVAPVYPEADLPAPSKTTPLWFLGLDVGTTGLSAVLLERRGGQVYPLYWSDNAISGVTADKFFRLPTLASVGSDGGSGYQVESVGSSALTVSWSDGDAADQGMVLLKALKPYLKLGIPVLEPDGGSPQPQIQWSDSDRLPLQVFQDSLRDLLTTLRAGLSPEAAFTVGAVGLETEAIAAAFEQLQGVVVSYPANWPDTYTFNLREAVMGAGLAASPDDIYFVEDAIAAVLSGLPDPATPLPEGNGQPLQQQTLYACPWTGGTVVISAGATVTEVGMVNLPRFLGDLAYGDFALHSMGYAGDAIDLDIICHLLHPAERRQSRPAEGYGRTTDTGGWGWQTAMPELEGARWDALDLDGCGFPRPAEPDIALRQRLYQRLEASLLGQSVLEAARHLKIILQHQPQFELELADQRWVVRSKDLEDRIILPYIQRINGHLNRLLSESGLTTQGINQVICTGGSASLPKIARWLRQKFPNATIVQDTYHSDRPPSCSRVTYGLVNLVRYPQVLDLTRHQYSDMFLLMEVLRTLPEQPMPLSGILHLLKERGLNVEACQAHLMALLEGRLPPGLLPSSTSTPLVLAPASDALTTLATTPLFTRPGGQVYVPNLEQGDRLQAYMEQLLADKHQTLVDPLLSQLTALNV